MKKRIIISVLWLLSVVISVFIGGAISNNSWEKHLKNRSHSEIESEFLLDQMAKRAEAGLPSETVRDGISCLKQMWGIPLPPDILTELSSSNNYSITGMPHEYKGDIWLQAQLWSRAQSARNVLQMPTYHPPLEERRQVMRAYRLLPLWKYGQVDIDTTPCPYPNNEAPLWALYLTNPEDAWRRGVSLDGRGGK